MKRALITGIAGQDGSYLAEFLLAAGYEVHGTIRMQDVFCKYLPTTYGFTNPNLYYHFADLRDEMSLEKVIRKAHPDEIYNLAGQVFVPPSWTQPAETFDVNTGGLARILKIVDNVCKDARVYQASSSEMFGNAIKLKTQGGDLALNENDPMYPVSPYGASKLAAHKLVNVYRERGRYVVSGILFNHESPRRGFEMVTRKITHHIAKWANGDREPLLLGNTLSRRDWGFAKDYVVAMWQMLQQPKPDDYVVGTGVSHSVEDFLVAAIAAAGFPPDYRQKYVQSGSTDFTRKDELHCLVADYSKARGVLGWRPTHNFLDLVRMMVTEDIKAVSHEPASDVSIVR